MSEHKLIRLLITTGFNEEVLAVKTVTALTHPTLVEHEGQQYVYSRQWMPNVHVYIPSQRQQIDDFLGNEPL